MLEILRTATQTLDDYAPNDPILSNHGKLYIMPSVKRDMLMPENQLPMLVLNNLVAVENEKIKRQDEEFMNKLILKFCSPNKPVKSIGKCLQGVIRSSVQQQSLMKLESDSKKGKSGSLKDISFHGGVLRLPLIVVDEATESMFLNLIDFERLHVGTGNEVTSYIFFMDNIIDNVKDVSLLHSRGIIQNAIGSDKAVAKLFNSLSKDITLHPESSLDIVHNKVNDYSRKRWNEWRANLIHIYFRNPWAILSVIAALFVFALTIAQTIYTIYPSYTSSDSPPPPPLKKFP
ncbi:unnamed protein product [Ilex paraguariensis]|uniref:Uncharacterized protein n=1 Tax=Ilex paraguariensis TaxID=185542 RepID=A0ABC8UDS6_9AQUA